jgi:hypothetical protein
MAKQSRRKFSSEFKAKVLMLLEFLVKKNFQFSRY